MAFHVGQKVVCINSAWPIELLPLVAAHPPQSGSPQVGVTYTVSAVFLRNDRYGDAIDLMELPAPGDEDWEPGYFAFDFRPVVEKKTEIGMAILQEILDRETIKDDVPVKKPSKVQ